MKSSVSYVSTGTTVSSAASWHSRRLSKSSSNTSGMSGSSSNVSTVSNTISDETTKSKHEGPPTTVVMKTVPDNYTRELLLEIVNAAGFQADYDVVSLPMDLRTEKLLGYAFINFTTHEQAEQFKKHFHGFNRWQVACDNVCEV